LHVVQGDVVRRKRRLLAQPAGHSIARRAIVCWKTLRCRLAEQRGFAIAALCWRGNACGWLARYAAQFSRGILRRLRGVNTISRDNCILPAALSEGGNGCVFRSRLWRAVYGTNGNACRRPVMRWYACSGTFWKTG
jgi:hypothetical protein